MLESLTSEERAHVLRGRQAAMARLRQAAAILRYEERRGARRR